MPADKAVSNPLLDKLWDEINVLGGRSEQDSSYDQGIVDTVTKVLEIVEKLGGMDPKQRLRAVASDHVRDEPVAYRWRTRTRDNRNDWNFTEKFNAGLMENCIECEPLYTIPSPDRPAVREALEPFARLVGQCDKWEQANHGDTTVLLTAPACQGGSAKLNTSDFRRAAAALALPAPGQRGES